MDPFETRLGIRMDYEACLAYLALPPAGGVLLLVLEHKSDYVRFHAWQSSLVFTVLFVSAGVSHLVIRGEGGCFTGWSWECSGLWALGWLLGNDGADMGIPDHSHHLLVDGSDIVDALRRRPSAHRAAYLPGIQGR
jgi:uncharacterized membrane protein